jgi:hypothetical protein
MGEGIDYKIRVDDQGLDDAAKKSKELEGQLAQSQGKQTTAVKEGVNARTQLVRDGLAQQLRGVRETSQSELAILKEKLKKEEIDQKEYAARYVQIQAQMHQQAAQIKAQKQKLLPQVDEQKMTLGAPVALGFAASALSVGVLSRELSGLADHATQAKATIEGLESIVRFKLGQQAVPEATKALKEITASGLLSQSDGATALKNLISMGYGIDQASVIIKRNTDIAIKNRQAHYSVSEAVKVFTEGVKNGNSVLTDSTGITENLEPMLKKYGFTAQDLSDKLNGAAARQALLKEVIKQTEPFVGDAEKASGSYTGVMAKLTAQSDETKAALGRIAAEGLTPLIKAFTDGLHYVTDWFTGLSDLSQKVVFFGVVAAALAIPLGIMTMSALTAAGSFGALALAAKAAFIALMTNPVFLIVAGIAAVVTAIVGIHEATRATPGQALLQEKQQLDELAKSTALTVEQKKRLAEVNRQLTKEYGPLLAEMATEMTTYERKLQILGAIDRAQNKLKKFVELANPQEYADKVRDLELELKKLEQIQSKPSLFQQMAVDAATLQMRIDSVKSELNVLMQGAFKTPENKSKDAVRVPVIFVRDETSLEILRDKKWLNDTLLLQDQSYYTSVIMAREADTLHFEMSLAQKNFVMHNQKGFELANLQSLEMEKQRLEERAANTQDPRKKAQIAAAQKHNAQLLDAVKRRIDQEKALKEKNDAWNKKAAGEMYEFGQAILSAEKGSLYKWLAEKIRAVTRSYAEEMYAKAAGAFTMGNFGLAALYAAGGLAVQTAGELAAQAVEKGAPKADAGGGGPAPAAGGYEQPSTPSAGSGSQSIVQDNRVTINEHGTYLNEAEFIRNRLRPELAKIAAERGKTWIK